MASKQEDTKWFTPMVAVMWLSTCNLLNYIDRGIIPGAGTSIKGCLADNHNCPSLPAENCSKQGDDFNQLYDDFDFGGNKDQCVECPVCTTCNLTQTGFGIDTEQLGYLQSSFMIGYAIAGLIFANLVHKYQPFKLIGVALFAWIVAVTLCGVAGFLCEKKPGGELCDAYYLLLFARMLSGVGEAAVASLAVPYLDDVVDPKRKGMAMAIYFVAIPCGTAIGFIWGGKITEAFDGKWEWAYLVEGPLMLPFAISAFTINHRLRKSKRNDIPPSDGDGDSSLAINASSEISPRDPVDVAEDTPLIQIHKDNNNNQSGPNKSVVQQLAGCVKQPIYVSCVLGYAAYTAVVSGLAFYIPQFIQKNDPCSPAWNFSQSQSDFYTGAIVAGSGLIGTILGGFLVDNAAKADDTRRTRLLNISRQLTWQIAVSTVICLCAVLAQSPATLFLVVGLGCVILFTSTAGINLVINWSVPTETRAMGMAFSNVCIHALGDVPSPVVIGKLDDMTTPRLTIFITNLWLAWTILFWALCWFLSWRLPK